MEVVQGQGLGVLVGPIARDPTERLTRTGVELAPEPLPVAGLDVPCVNGENRLLKKFVNAFACADGALKSEPMTRPAMSIAPARTMTFFSFRPLDSGSIA